MLAAAGLAAAPVLPAQTATVPARTNDNLIVAAYNIQWLGDRPHDNAKLARVIRHFDVCGVIEIKKEQELVNLRDALEALTNQAWGYVYGVRTHRPSERYHESYGALWRKDRVELGDGVAGGFWDLEEAFRNDPYVVSFRRRDFDFALVLIHTRWTDDEEGTREGEVRMMAEQLLWMSDFIPEQDFIVAGDFNYAGTHRVMRAMAVEADLVQLDPNVGTTVRSGGGIGYTNSAYDHIYVPRHTAAREYVANSADAVDVIRMVYGDHTAHRTATARSELSDHIPVFAVFRVDMGDDDP
jgi:hypothetical protein